MEYFLPEAVAAVGDVRTQIIFSDGTQQISSRDGQLKKGLCPCGKNKLNFHFKVAVSNLFNHTNPPKWIILICYIIIQFEIYVRWGNTRKIVYTCKLCIITCSFISNSAFRNRFEVMIRPCSWNDRSKSITIFHLNSGCIQCNFWHVYKLNAFCVAFTIIKESFRCQNLVSQWSLQTCSCCQSFYCATNTITRRFPVVCDEKSSRKLPCWSPICGNINSTYFCIGLRICPRNIEYYLSGDQEKTPMKLHGYMAEELKHKDSTMI